MNIEEKIYSGILGKAIGVRLGAPIEPYQWTYDAIKESYGTIQGYIKDSHVFAADDDTNGPIFFVRSLLDENESMLTHEAISKAWLNYARDGQGMFWWGGDGISTEHTAYNRLKEGYIAPKSGSQAVNGKVISEQVGGQIFIDSWGLINPGDIDQAMADAKIAASVAHDGDALIGAQFIAGMIAGAFISDDIETLICNVISRLDMETEYVQVLHDVFMFYEKNPDDFRKAYDYVLQHYSYDHYEGMCHVIPNACIVLIGLLYGNNDFSRSIEITCMCGWDTDSNAGVVGTIMGVFSGLDGIPIHYREPINDTIIASSMSPSLNTVNAVDFAQMLFQFSQKSLNEKEKFDLSFPFKGSSSGLKIHNTFRLVQDQITWNTVGSYNVLIDNLVKEDQASIVYQTFYEKDDFYDNRYDPVFAPLVYPNQTLKMLVQSEITFIDELYGSALITYTNGETKQGEFIHLKDKQDILIEFKLPENQGYPIKEIGLVLKTVSDPIDGNGLLGRIKIKEFKVEGKGQFKLNQNSYCDSFLNNVSPFANHRINSQLRSDGLEFNSKEQGISITGLYHSKNINMDAVIKDCVGTVLLPFGVKGLENYYAFKITEYKIELIHRHFLKNVPQVTFVRTENSMEDLNVSLKIEDRIVKLQVNEQCVEYHINDDLKGHYGWGVIDGSLRLDSMVVEFD
ncbi:ADP-ribosylglycohydrolase family protein [Erysipelothrix urinaevulpis]|uniref:ADP-ribosylglycohydrolase family protein n=1 Tax=Erysipelothrix urinaevulpis TaxID=2683717 RepID=UPI00135C96F4|nr:ADP-ribosylglycohydrolase family protein [Erysipelothrix urinaevulpis]